MENLDIEKLERKNIYKLPDDAFEKMQVNVLQETFPPKKGKIIKMNWIYSAAAAVTLLFGLSFFINNDPQSTENVMMGQTSPKEESSVATVSLPIDKEVKEYNEKNSKELVPENNEEILNTKKSKSLAVSNPNEVRTSKSTSNKKIQSAEIPMDQIIASFTSADLADLGKNTEQDIYLDLYN